MLVAVKLSIDATFPCKDGGGLSGLASDPRMITTQARGPSLADFSSFTPACIARTGLSLNEGNLDMTFRITDAVDGGGKCVIAIGESN